MPEFPPLMGRTSEIRRDANTANSSAPDAKDALDYLGAEVSFVEVKSEKNSELEWGEILELSESEHLEEDMELEFEFEDVDGDPDDYGSESGSDTAGDEKSTNNKLSSHITAVWISVSSGPLLLSAAERLPALLQPYSVLRIILHFLKVWLRFIFLVLLIVAVVFSAAYLVYVFNEINNNDMFDPSINITGGSIKNSVVNNNLGKENNPEMDFVDE